MTENSAAVDVVTDHVLDEQPMPATGVRGRRRSTLPGGEWPVGRPSLDALGVELCLSVSYLSAIAPEIVFAEILDECGLELAMRGGGAPGRDLLADVAVEFGLAVVLDGMPDPGSLPAVLSEVAAAFAVTVVSAAAADRRRVA